MRKFIAVKFSARDALFTRKNKIRSSCPGSTTAFYHFKISQWYMFFSNAIICTLRSFQGEESSLKREVLLLFMLGKCLSFFYRSCVFFKTRLTFWKYEPGIMNYESSAWVIITDNAQMVCLLKSDNMKPAAVCYFDREWSQIYALSLV